ncbi:thrombospondin type 3 repeat-containing protein [bacterium]|nr:thrombospondin type 3 repeat-containing protein [bacterium]
MEDENLDDLEQPQKSSLGLKQKIAIPVLGIFALVLVFLWASDLNSTIKNSLNLDNENSGQEALNNIGNTCLNGNCGEVERTNIDSDNDGLFDWEETEKYGTSPYLEDTDGDGYTDKEEVDSNYDPNCPRGKDCYIKEEIEEEAKGQNDNTGEKYSSEFLSSGLSAELNPGSLSAGDNNNNMGGVVSGDSTPDELREMLKQAGIDENMLNAVSDDELMQAYRETLNQNN